MPRSRGKQASIELEREYTLSISPNGARHANRNVNVNGEQKNNIMLRLKYEREKKCNIKVVCS